jgi:hypothetical protein
VLTFRSQFPFHKPFRIHYQKLNSVAFSPQANYTDRATATRQQSKFQLLRIEGVEWSAQRIPTAVDFGFLDRSLYFSIQVASQLSSRGWVVPVPDPLLLRKSGRAGNRTRNLRICSQELWPLDHRGGRIHYHPTVYILDTDSPLLWAWVRIRLLTPVVTCMSGYRRGFGLEIRFIDHFNTRFVTTLNYSAIADLHTSQITTAHAKSFQFAVFTRHSLVTASNSEDSSAPALTLLPVGSQLVTDCLTTDWLLNLFQW